MSSEPTQADRKEANPPAVWATIANDVREFDQDNVKRGKGDVDTLLVFAGLFSAVLASFLVAVYPSLQPSPMDVMNYTLRCIANQTASYNFTDGRMIATNPSSPPPPFKASAEDIRVNVLWFASLIISLMTSSFGMLVKQWMDDFLAVDIPEPQARLRIRHHRAPQIEAWLVYEIVACLPLLLHLSLGLFFVGLCYFTAAIHASIGYTTLPLVIGWTFCLFSTTALPIFFPRCPYKISLFKPMIARFHRTVSRLSDKKRIHRSWRSYLPDPAQAATRLVEVMRTHVERQRWLIRLQGWRIYLVELCAVIPQTLLSHLSKMCSTIMQAFRSRLSEMRSTIMQALRDIPDEDKVAKDSAADLKIFASIDAMRANDEILRLVVTEELPLIKPSIEAAFSFTIEVLTHRARTVTEAECLIPEWSFRDPFPLDLIRAQARESISNILVHNYAVDCSGWVGYDRNVIPMPLRRDSLPDKEQRRVLCTLTMLISDVSNSSEVKLPPNIVRFLRYYLDEFDGPTVCRDVLSLMVWHCADAESCWDTTARLITSLGKLMAPLNLTWEDKTSCFKSIFCLKATYPPGQLTLHPHLTWNHPRSDDGFGAWENWNIPDNTPNTLKGAALEYLFILLSAEFKRVEDSKGSSPEASANQETPEVLCCALRHFVEYASGEYLPSSGYQAFVDSLSTKSKELMDILIESLVSTNFHHAQSSASRGSLLLRWSPRTCYAIRREHQIKPSTTTTKQSFPVLLSIVKKKFGFTTADHPTSDPDIDLHQCLSLCHIVIFLYLAIYAQPDKPELGQELFSSIADTLKRETEGCGAKIFNDKVARQLAYDCLYIMHYEQECNDWLGYNEWLGVFSPSRKTSFPDALVEVLGQFGIPDHEVYRLYRLRELKGRHHSAQPHVDAPPDQQASNSEVQSTEQDENPVVAVDELPDLTTPTYPSIVQDLPMAGPSTGVEGGLEDDGRSEGEGGSEGEGKPEGTVDERDSTMEEHEPEMNRRGGEGEEELGRPDDEVS